MSGVVSRLIQRLAQVPQPRVTNAYRTYGGHDQQTCVVERDDGVEERITHWAAEPGYEEGAPYDKCRLCPLTEGNVVGRIQPLTGK